MKKFQQSEQNKSLKVKSLYLTVILILSTTFLSAQNGVIKGKIIDANTKEPLIGAAAMIKGTTIGSASNFDGDYTIENVKPGKYTITSSYISYKPFTKENVVVTAGKETIVNIELDAAGIALKEVELVAKSNRESENILLMQQKQSLIATQAVGAKEMSRKGISNAEAAVAQVSGVSKQEGVKNVFVRGLGDRYNFTTLNGLPIPSEDPEYKNISLDFFGSDIIQNIGVSKAFTANGCYSDAGGAVIDISSKELVGDKELGLDLSGGYNSQSIGADFSKMDGVNYWGISTNTEPDKHKTDYAYGDNLNPDKINMPMNYSYGFSAGKSFKTGENRNPLSFYVVGSYSTSASYTPEKSTDAANDGTEYDLKNGNKSSININQLLLGNLNYIVNKKHQLYYNFMLIHDNNQYVGDYYVTNSSDFNNDTGSGFIRRQQSNDNIVIVNQLLATFKLNNKSKLDASLSYNNVKGTEPDRRSDVLFLHSDDQYLLYPSEDAHVRNYQQLIENDLNAKVTYTYKLAEKFKTDASALSMGFNSRYLTDNFNATQYYFNVAGFVQTTTIENLNLDNWLNQDNLTAGKITPGERPSHYNVTKAINKGFASLDYQFSKSFSGNIGLSAEQVYIYIYYDIHSGREANDDNTLTPFYVLPYLNLKYNLDDKNALRFGLSKTYTLPQSKEISPYQYIGLTDSYVGNPHLKPSDNYNVDLKWDYYISPSELISLNGFYKYIKKPISRIYEFNAAGYYTYDNISDHATVAGIELEARKNIINRVNTEIEKSTKLSAGLNASYIYTNTSVTVNNGENSGLEGAAPYIVNFDLTYDYSHKNSSFVNSLVLNYFSDRIYSIGVNFMNTIEKGIPTLNFVSEYKTNKHLKFKLKAKNILDPTYTLTRDVINSDKSTVLSSYKKGIDVSLGISYNFY
ncbi:MAG: TonB-dependent receptor [Paludibacter sp.]|nr:TonB-dependent receptor [Paludibacter sp.]